ncbi:hypothetical protein RCL1_007470 [Eukaryota sp. TZLM3-RCL]
MGLLHKIRSIVSQTHRRYTLDGFNLDLSYITPNIIAMGLPAEGFTAAYRNDANEVARMLELTHPNRYMIFNLAAENTYNYEAFKDSVLEFGFPDHHPPTLSLLFSVVSSMDRWLLSDPLNVAVVHCKAGKGRTGVVVSCYLLWSNKVNDPYDALQCFAGARSTEGVGVQNPSQIRYVDYFHSCLYNLTFPVDVVLRLQSIKCPLCRFLDLQRPAVEIYQNFELVNKSPLSKPSKTDQSQEMSIVFDYRIELANDVMIKLVDMSNKKLKFLRVIFHTGFIFRDFCKNGTNLGSNFKVLLYKKDLDGPHKNSSFDENFYLEMNFSVVSVSQNLPEWLSAVLSKRKVKNKGS